MSTEARRASVPPRPESPPRIPPPEPEAGGGSPYGDEQWRVPRPLHGPAVPPETPAETTTRLRPVPAGRRAGTLAAVVCLVLGLGLIGGAAAGIWLSGDTPAEPADDDGYTTARALWHSAPVDTLFPRTVRGEGAGPGGADRTWSRIAVAPDSGCAGTLGPLLLRSLASVGCIRVLRATYTDATSSSVSTVGYVFTRADHAAMVTLRARFKDQELTGRTDLMPPAFPVEGTVAAGFGDRQRASWTVNVLTGAPVVVFGVSGFADGRAVSDPQPADEAVVAGATSAPAQAGLGHDAKGLAAALERGLRKTADAAAVVPR